MRKNNITPFRKKCKKFLKYFLEGESKTLRDRAEVSTGWKNPVLHHKRIVIIQQEQN